MYVWSWAKCEAQINRWMSIKRKGESEQTTNRSICVETWQLNLVAGLACGTQMKSLQLMFPRIVLQFNRAWCMMLLLNKHCIWLYKAARNLITGIIGRFTTEEHESATTCREPSDALTPHCHDVHHCLYCICHYRAKQNTSNLTYTRYRWSALT